jgi:hypothetical protein
VWSFYKEVIFRALWGTPGLVSWNWTGVLVSLIVFFVGTFIIKATRQDSYKQASTRRQKLAAMHDHWRQNLQDGAKITAIVWGGLFFVSLARIIYQDHKSTSRSVVTLTEERDIARGERDAIKNESANLRQQLESKMTSSGKTKVSVPSTHMPETNLNAPNGVAIGGNNLGSATVSNMFSDIYPRSGVIPDVNFCIPGSSSDVITITTDTEITAPFWGLVFDGAVTGATVDMEDTAHEPFGWTDGHPSGFQLGQLTEPLGAFPVESRLLLAADVNTRVYTDNVLRIQVTEIGSPFGGPSRPWGPKDRLKVTVKSSRPVHLIAIASGYGRKYLAERMIVGCAK